MKKTWFLFFVWILSCKNEEEKNSIYSKEDLLREINIDSLIFNKSENTIFDRFGDSSGSLYKFNENNELVFYCFLNNKIYPYAEYYGKDGKISKVEGKPSVQVRYTLNPDKSYRFSFLYSTFRKSDFKIHTITNFGDTLYNGLSPAVGFSNVGFFNIVVLSYKDVSNTSIVNNVNYFDNLQNEFISFNDTLNLKDVVDDE